MKGLSPKNERVLASPLELGKHWRAKLFSHASAHGVAAEFCHVAPLGVTGLSPSSLTRACNASRVRQTLAWWHSLIMLVQMRGKGALPCHNAWCG